MNNPWLAYIPSFIRSRLEGRQTFQKILANTGWLFFDKILRMGVGLLVNVWVVRYLGPDQFGHLSYAIAFVALFGAFATLGLDGIVIREVVRNPGQADEILGSAFYLKLVGSAITLIVSVAAIFMLRNNDTLSWILVAIFAASTVFQAFDVIDFWFQSQVLSRYTVIAKNSAFLVMSVVKVCLIMGHASLTAFAWAALAEIIVGAIGLVLAYRKCGRRLSEWRGTLGCSRRLLGDSWPLILSGLSVAIYMKLDQVMLGEMAGVKAVGIYTSATKLTEIWYMIPMVIVSSVFPAMVQSKNTNEELYYRRITRLFSLMAAVSLLIALPMSLASNWLVLQLYGIDYQAAGPVLAVHIWASLFVFYGVAQGSWDLTENLTRLAMIRIVIGAIVNIALNLWLIPRYGALGAAIATVVSQALAAVLLNLIHKKTRPIFFCQMKSLLFMRYLRGL